MWGFGRSSNPHIYRFPLSSIVFFSALIGLLIILSYLATCRQDLGIPPISIVAPKGCSGNGYPATEVAATIAKSTREAFRSKAEGLRGLLLAPGNDEG